MSEPRLTRLRLEGTRPTSARRAKFARARLGMTLSQLKGLGISPAECRWLAARGTVVFDPPIPDRLPSGAHPGQRRARLGPIRRREGQAMMRPCLCCREDFPSEGSHNRLCKRCRTLSPTPFE